MAWETAVQFQVESYQRLKKWYLIPPCLTLGIIRYVSKVKWSNPGKGVVSSPTHWCSSPWKGSLWVANFTFTYLSLAGRKKRWSPALSPWALKSSVKWNAKNCIQGLLQSFCSLSWQWGDLSDGISIGYRLVGSDNQIMHNNSISYTGIYSLFPSYRSPISWGAVEYTDCITTEEVRPLHFDECPDMTLNNLMARLQS